MGSLARGYNEIGKFAEAKAVCESALAHVTDADREYPAFFLSLDIELAIAQASLGQSADALARLNGLLERYADCDHPLLYGLLHEARARVALIAGKADQYAISLAEVESRFRASGEASLIARYDRLAQQGGADPGRISRTPQKPSSSAPIDEPLTEDSRETEIVFSKKH
jgi:hypothetical protein